MREKTVNILGALMLSAAVILPASFGPGFVTVASAADNNYLKISSSAIGQTRRVSVPLNKSMVIDLPDDAHDILVANPEVADAITRTSRRIYVFAKTVGETNVFIFDKNGKQLLSLDLVIERDIQGLKSNIEKYIRGADIEVEIVNDNIVLTGTVPTPQDASRAVQLAQVFVKGGEATSSGGSGGSSGTTINFGGTDDRVSSIVNLLAIEGEDQVNLKVTIAEIQRTVVKQLGIDLDGTLSRGNLSAAIFTDNPLGLGKTTSESAVGFSAGDRLSGMLRALDQTGVMRTLAEPSLTAISGESASFRVGGDFQVTDGKSEGDTGVTYSAKTVTYGIGLAFKPVVLSAGRISINLKTEVSEPTTEGNFVTPRGSAGAATAPGIRRREAETTVELPSGGSMIIAGLLRDDVRQTVTGFPGLAKIPILGTLFRSRDFQRYESELVIIVTPYLVKPVARQALARPDDNFNASADGAGMFLGRVNRIYGTVEGKLPKGQYHGNPGFILK